MRCYLVKPEENQDLAIKNLFGYYNDLENLKKSFI
jgi:hypothetical protein